MATTRNIYDLTLLSKTSVDNFDFFETANSAKQTAKKITVASLFPTMSTTGTGGQDVFVNVSNKNQLNYKGLISGDTGLLTLATTSNNVVFTVLEAGIDLSLCNNETSGFLSGVDFTGTVTGENAVTNGGTGLSTIVKGGLLYADIEDSIAATAAPTNGQILIGNSTLGYPVLNTITGGTNTDVVNTAGTITINSTLSTMAADLDMANYDIDLGTGWISGNGTHEGININAEGKVFIGEDTPTAFFDEALNVKGNLSFDADTAPTIKPVARSGSAGVKLTLESGSASGAIGGDLDIKAGSSTSGNHNGGTLNLYGGDEAGTGAAGSIKNFVSNGSGSEIEALTITGGSANPDVTISRGNLIVTEAQKGIVHAGMGTVVQGTDHTTEVEINSTSGKIQLAAVALAAGVNAEFTVQNDSVQADSIILLSMQDENTTNNTSLTLSTHTIANNSFVISIHNPAATGATSTTASFVHFLVINNSIAD